MGVRRRYFKIGRPATDQICSLRWPADLLHLVAATAAENLFGQHRCSARWALARHRRCHQILDRRGGRPGDAIGCGAPAARNDWRNAKGWLDQVFDDRNANGYQDEGEPGLKGARVISARGITATTDAEGRYHVACAAVPQMDIGSNFVLKLDERSLPSGYRVTTENPLTERLTRGKAVRMNFGATIHRLVRVDLTASAFESGGKALTAAMRSRVTEMMPLLVERPSILRIGYAPASAESASLTTSRVDGLKALVKTLWADQSSPPDKPGGQRGSQRDGLEIEVEIVRDTQLVPGKVAVDGGAK